MKPQNLPIGYWIKKADDLLTKSIDAIQASFQLTRKDWQMLNAINENVSFNTTDLIKLMEPFAGADNVTAVLKRFETEGITNRVNNNLSLTGKGEKLHSACLKQQLAFRQKAMTGIEDKDYQTTVQVLQKIAANIGEAVA